MPSPSPNSPPPNADAGADPRAEALVASYTRGADNPYQRIAPPVLQPRSEEHSLNSSHRR